MNKERFVLRKRQTWFVIARLVEDTDFDPPLWVEEDEIGHFRNRDDARRFMVARSSPFPDELPTREEA